MSIGRSDLYVNRPKMRQHFPSSAENVEDKQLDPQIIWQWIPACWMRTATEKKHGFQTKHNFQKYKLGTLDL